MSLHTSDIGGEPSHHRQPPTPSQPPYTAEESPCGSGSIGLLLQGAGVLVAGSCGAGEWRSRALCRRVEGPLLGQRGRSGALALGSGVRAAVSQQGRPWRCGVGAGALVMARAQ